MAVMNFAVEENATTHRGWSSESWEMAKLTNVSMVQTWINTISHGFEDSRLTEVTASTECSREGGQSAKDH